MHFIKYMGSKSRIAKEIVPIIQSYIDNNTINNYYEPFVGGANVIDKIKCSNKYGSDLNKYLIALLQYVQSGGKLYDNVSREFYNEVKAAYKNNTNEFTDYEIGNVGFLASFGGKFFDGGYAKPIFEKTKTGKTHYRDYYAEAVRNLMKQVSDIQDVKFKCCDYKEIKVSDSVIYCDPPYANTTTYANATKFNYSEFWNVMSKWSTNNIVLVSELIAPEDWVCIWEKKNIQRSLGDNNKQRAVEKLFIHKTNLTN